MSIRSGHGRESEISVREHMLPLPPESEAESAMYPLGLQSLYEACLHVYPDQPNPLQVTAVVKYWLGGPDPLDYISMYSNKGQPNRGVPPHWHYVSFGLSDLHGDSRVHPVKSGGPSGFGFELSLRLRQEPGENAPPTWPAAILQSLAKYVFQSGNTLCVGDHVSWHCSLDSSESRIQHMLMAEDPQLGVVNTPFGSVQFVQIVGVTSEELKAVQHWNGPAVLSIFKRVPGIGGSWLVTDMRRGESMYELDPTLLEEVDRGIENEGSNLSGVSAVCSWVEWGRESSSESPPPSDNEVVVDKKEAIEEEERAKNVFKKVFLKKSQSSASKQETSETGTSGRHGKSPHLSKNESSGSLQSSELLNVCPLEGIHLTLNLEAGSLLPLGLRGRVRHGRHFTFKSVVGSTAITLVSLAVTGSFVNLERPYAIQGPWIQLLITDELANQMLHDLSVLSQTELLLPKTFEWTENKIAITIVPDVV